jgi:hypothetical protein
MVVSPRSYAVLFLEMPCFSIFRAELGFGHECPAVRTMSFVMNQAHPFATRALRLALASVALALRASTARAEPLDCGAPGVDFAWAPVEVTPASGAQGVTLDAPLVVAYRHGYFTGDGPGGDESGLITLELCPLDANGVATRCSPGAGSSVDGGAMRFGDRVVFSPAAPLLPARWYAARATGVDGKIDFPFRTGSIVDTQAPVVGGMLRSEPEAAEPTCPWIPEGGRRVGFVFAPPSEDGPAGSVEYLLFLTRGADVGAPQLRDRLRVTAEEVQLPLLLTPTEASEPVCVRVVAIDGVGRVSTESPEHCIDPLTGASFQPLCSAGHASSGRGPLFVAWMIFLAGAALRLVSRRQAKRD